MKKMIGLTLALSLLVSLCPMAMAMTNQMDFNYKLTFEENSHAVGSAPFVGTGSNLAFSGNTIPALTLVEQDEKSANKYVRMKSSAADAEAPSARRYIDTLKNSEKNMISFKMRADDIYGAKSATVKFANLSDSSFASSTNAYAALQLIEFRNGILYVRGEGGFTTPVFHADVDRWYTFIFCYEHATQSYKLYCDNQKIDEGNYFDVTGQEPTDTPSNFVLGRLDFSPSAKYGTTPPDGTYCSLSLDDVLINAYDIETELSGKTYNTTTFTKMSNEYLTLLFSNFVDVNELTADNITITEKGGAIVPAENYTLSYDATVFPNKLHILFETPLTLDTTYAISVQNVKDVFGNVVPAYSAEFTTQPAEGNSNFYPYTEFSTFEAGTAIAQSNTQGGVNFVRIWAAGTPASSVVEDTDNNGNPIKAVKFTPGAIVAQQTLFYGTSVFELEMKFATGSTGSVTLRPNDASANSFTLFNVTSANSGTFQINSLNNNTRTVKTGVYDKYLNIKIILDNDTKQYDFYLDGVQVGHGLPMPAAGDYTYSTRYRFNSAGAEMYLASYEVYRPARGTITYNEGASMDPMSYLNFTIDDNVNPDSVNKGSFAIDNGAKIGSVALADKSVSVEFEGGLDYDKTYTITALDSISNLIGIPAKGTGNYQLTTPQENSDVTGIRYKYGTEEVQNIRPGELTAEVDLDLTSSSAKKKVTFILAVYDKINNTLLDVDVVATNYDGFTSPTVSLTTTVPAEGTYYAKVIMLKNFDSMKPFSLTGFKTVLE